MYFFCLYLLANRHITIIKRKLGITVRNVLDVKHSPCAQRDSIRLRKWVLPQCFKLMATPKKERKLSINDLCHCTGVSRKYCTSGKKMLSEEDKKPPIRPPPKIAEK